MPLLEGVSHHASAAAGPSHLRRRESEQYSTLARAAMLSVASATSSVQSSPDSKKSGASVAEVPPAQHDSLMPPARSAFGRVADDRTPQKNLPASSNAPSTLGRALSDTPAPSTPVSPSM